MVAESVGRDELADGRVEMHRVVDADGYDRALDLLPAFLDRHAITDVVYLAGMDPYDGDPVGGIDDVTADFLHARDRRVIDAVRTRGIATVVNFAGGYVADKVVDLHAGTVEAMRRAADSALVMRRRADSPDAAE